MRTYTSGIQAVLDARVTLRQRILLWITAKDRTTGAAESVGFWNGFDNLDFTINGVTRTYYGAGNMLGVDAITMVSGLTVQSQKVKLSAIAPEVELAIRQYDARLAPVEMHKAYFDPLSEALIDAPVQIFTGWVDKLQIDRAAENGNFTGTLTLVSAARALTRMLGTTKSDADLRRRSSTDAFRKYASIASAVTFFWGEQTTTPAAVSPASPGVQPINYAK
ncbi:MAG: hypothetical protein KGL25_03190 [Gammaproteobacteria bacterium]|nr:hypothetical protein [Gammaproteobacteria bacterium]